MDHLPSGLTFRSVEAATWADLERLFEARGGPSYCWCMPFRATPQENRNLDRTTRKDGMRSRVMAGVPVGILAYAGDEPIGWCSIAPRPTFPRPNTSAVPGAARADDPSVWALTCFFVPRRLRGSGLASRLLEAALDYAGEQGAAAVEAYPVDPDSPSYRFGGTRPMFQAVGARELGPLGLRRHVVRIDLTGESPSPQPSPTVGRGASDDPRD
ncbi:MAG: GNAT family N-acetyltransferase [Chloroflexi bacterium]|nr:GNAT family N-acetyltransferase [Chloroflexota bacterium]